MSQIELYTLCPVFQIERWHRLVQLTTTHIVQKCLKLNSTPCVQCGLFWKVNVSQSHGWDGTRPGGVYQPLVIVYVYIHIRRWLYTYILNYMYTAVVTPQLIAVRTCLKRDLLYTQKRPTVQAPLDWTSPLNGLKLSRESSILNMYILTHKKRPTSVKRDLLVSKETYIDTQKEFSMY
jgi:hypothetical protein